MLEALTIEAAFGQVIKELRKQRGCSQETLSNESNLDRSYISLLECGRKQPTLVTIFQIAKALRVSPSEIVAEVELRSGQKR
jgi:transcriptional regulator with XRE-family HTH domain